MIDLNEIAKKANAKDNSYDYHIGIIFNHASELDYAVLECSKNKNDEKQYKDAMEDLNLELLIILNSVLALMSKDGFNVEQGIEKFLSTDDFKEKVKILFDEV
ncbi:MAG: hypothetical protein ACRC4W_08590 [Treponemataceae bacterium]